MPNSAEEWYRLFQLAQSVLMALAAILIWLWGRERKDIVDNMDRKNASTNTRIDVLEKQTNMWSEEIEERIDNGNQELSRLTGVVQTLMGRMDRLPEDLRLKFMPLDRANDHLEEAKRDRAALWSETQRLREQLRQQEEALARYARGRRG